MIISFFILAIFSAMNFTIRLLPLFNSSANGPVSFVAFTEWFAGIIGNANWVLPTDTMFFVFSSILSVEFALVVFRFSWGLLYRIVGRNV